MHYSRVESEKLQKQIAEAKNMPFSVGEKIFVKEKHLYSYTRNPESAKSVTIVDIDGDNAIVKVFGSKDNKSVPLEHCIHNIHKVGANPFSDFDWVKIARPIAYSLESIIFEFTREKEQYFNTTVDNVNWNPYIIDKDGNKQYYQRDLVWTLEDKQCLIDSIYNYISCGKIVVRKHSFKEVEENHTNGDGTMAWLDIVDGKQRMHTIIEFINNEFPDRYGNYFCDLSHYARTQLTDHQLFSYCEIGEDASDEDVLRTFLMVNFSGVPMSQEHIDYVQKLYQNVTDNK